MQILCDSRLYNRLIGLVTNGSIAKIMATTLERAMSARDLSKFTQIPLSTVYRRITKMRKNGLLQVEKVVLGDDGKKVELVRSVYASFTLDIMGSDIILLAEVPENTERPNNFAATDCLERITAD